MSARVGGKWHADNKWHEGGGSKTCIFVDVLCGWHHSKNEILSFVFCGWSFYAHDLIGGKYHRMDLNKRKRVLMWGIEFLRWLYASLKYFDPYTLAWQSQTVSARSVLQNLVLLLLIGLTYSYVLIKRRVDWLIDWLALWIQSLLQAGILLLRNDNLIFSWSPALWASGVNLVWNLVSCIRAKKLSIILFWGGNSPLWNGFKSIIATPTLPGLSLCFEHLCSL